MQPSVSPHAKENKIKLVWGLILLIAPTALILVAIIAYAVVNFIVGSSNEATPVGSSGELAFTSSPVTVVANVILYIVGAVSVISFVPGIVIGIVLLATRK